MAKRGEREVEIEEDRDLEGTNSQDIKDKVLDNEPEEEEDDDGADNAEARREQEEEERRRKAAESEEDDDDDDARLAYSEDEDDEPRGRSRRQRRNRARREMLAQKDAVIDNLAGQLQELRGVVDQMSRGQLDLYAGDIDTRLQAERARLAQIDNAIAQSIKDQDGDTYARTQRLRDEARDRIYELEVAGRRLAAQARDPQPQHRQTTDQGKTAPDPRAVRFSQTFMKRHPDFDVNGGDEDSRIVKAIDDNLAAEGYLPHTARYWVELEKRVKARGLFQDSENYGDDDMDDEDRREERSERRPAKRSFRPSAGRNGGGGRPAGEGFRLTPMMRDTLDQLGLLDEKNLSDDQKKQRRSYVKQWAAGMKEAAQGAR